MCSTFRALIGVDGSENSDEAFQFYTEKMHNPEREVLLVYVVKPLTISSNELSINVGEIRERNLIEERTRVKQIKEIYEERMRTYGIQGKINIIYYSRKPGKILCELAIEEKCTVIVLGCRRSGTANLGPTVDYVLHKAPCPVILAGGKERRESCDSIASLSQFELMKTEKDSNPRFRRISCPVMRSPPLVPEAVGAGGAVGGATGGETESMLGVKVGGGANGGPQPPAKQRRHSTFVNAFQQLSLQESGRKKLLPKKPETTNDSEESK